ncbi:MAG: hypothetical protein HKN39_01445 [Flavobacteriales bacterium]|nr:hypothetical protein [Flavobacteriales bacterium]
MKFGLLGKNISYSLSPILHQVFADLTGLVITYDLLDLDHLHIAEGMTVLEYCELNEYNGVNVTIPLKEELIDQVDERSEEVERIGSLNTIQFKEHLSKAFSTDLTAIKKTALWSLQDVEAGGSFLIKGAGGFARAAAFALGELGAMHIYIVNRDFDRAIELEEDLNDHNIKAMALEERDMFEDNLHFDGLMNATPVGMGESIEMPFDLGLIKKARWVIESVYTPQKTMFLDMAHEFKKDLISGSSLLFHQGADSFELWTGKTVDRVAAWSLFLERIK